MKKKLWSILLALCMVLSLLPLSAFAAESDSAAAGGLLRQPELEASIVYRDADESIVTPSARKLQAAATNSVCTTIEECGAALREGIKQRQNPITFTYVSDEDMTEDFLRAINNEALRHTGVPTEGDYIRWQVGGSNTSASSSDGVNYAVTFYFNSFHDTLAQEQETDAAVAEIVSSLQGKSDYEILKWIYDYLGETVTYDYDAAETPQNQITDYTPWTAYGALVKHKAVCQGYALAFYRLALEMGIDARIVTGTGNGGDHAWIAAKLEGRYYFIDATWGGENNFLKGTETFENHYPDSESDDFLAEMTLSPTDYVPSVASGQCGEDVYWSLSEDGVLYIHGSGKMYDYTGPWGDNLPPWDAKAVTALVIEPGVTSIGLNAFAECENMLTASIPEGVTRIGNSAFENVALQELNIPASVTDIGYYFIRSAKLRLTNIDVLHRINVHPDNPVYKSVDGVLFSKDGTQLIRCPDGLMDAWIEPGVTNTYVVPDGVREIGIGAFSNCTFLQEIVLPEGLTTVEGSAFNGCIQLQSATFPDSVTTVGDYTFQMCGMLESVHLGKNLTSFGKDCFAFNDRLTEITVDPENPVYRSIDGVLFNKAGDELIQFPTGRSTDGPYVIPDGVTKFRLYMCRKLAEVQIPDSVTKLDSLCFGFCNYLTSVTIPRSVTEIESAAFQGCYALTDVYYLGTQEQWDAIQIDPTDNDPLLSATVHFQSGPSITQQPVDYTGALDSTARFTIAAEGEGLSYQWQISTNGGKSWSRSSVTSAVYAAKLTAEKDGRMVRCVVTDRFGNSVTTEPAAMYVAKQITITQQPRDYYGELNSQAVFTVAATGTGTLHYQWQVSTNDGETWSRSSVTTPRYSAKLTLEKDNRMVRCVISDDYGNSITSDPGVMYLEKQVTITQQPEDYTGALNSTARFTVAAEGYGTLSYQWYISTNDGRTWSKSSVTSPVYAAKLTAEKDGRLVHCVVTDSYGNSAGSFIAAMHVAKEITITQQPVDYHGELNSQAVFTVEASGTGPLHYQWQVSTNGGRTWSRSSVTSAVYAAKLTQEKDNRLVRCIVTDDYGGSVTTESALMHIVSPLTITQQPRDYYGELNSQAVFTVAATGTGTLHYQWQVSTNDGETWSRSSVTTPRYSAKLTLEKDNRMVRCVISDDYGNSITSDPGVMYLEKRVTITQQPVNYVGAENSTARFTVVAEGYGTLHYQWYVSTNGGRTWSKSSVTSAVYAAKLTAEKDGRLVYCMVTDSYGNGAVTDTVRMKIG